MNEALVLIATGLFLVGLLVFLLRRTELTTAEPFAASKGPTAFRRFDDRRAAVVDRIFGAEDWHFVRAHASKEIQGLFLKERRRIALCWLSEVRGRARDAMRFHLVHAGKFGEIVPMLELRLAANYVVIQARCEFIALILVLWGPVAVRGMVSSASHLSEQLGDLLEVTLKPETLAKKTVISN